MLRTIGVTSAVLALAITTASADVPTPPKRTVASQAPLAAVFGRLGSERAREAIRQERPRAARRDGRNRSLGDAGVRSRASRIHILKNSVFIGAFR